MCTKTDISTVAKFLLKELEKRFVYVQIPVLLYLMQFI